MFYFIVLGAAFELNWDISKKKYSSELPDFAFSKGGTFNIDFFGNNISNTVIVLFNHSYYNENRYVLKSQLGFCWENKSNGVFLEHRVKTFEYDRWNVTFNASDVYYPIIYNCHKKNVRALVTYLNPHSYIDGRKGYIPYIALMLSVIYITFTFLWISNFFNYPKINIILTYYLSALTAFKSISIALVALYWIEKSERKHPRKIYMIYYFIDAFVNGNIYIFNIMAAEGLGTIKSFYKSKDYIRHISMLIYTCLSSSLLDTMEMYAYRLLVFIRLIIFLKYSAYVNTSRNVFAESCHTYYNNQLVSLKCNHVLKFSNVHFKTCIYTIVFLFFAFFSRTQVSIQFTCDELLIFLILYVDYIHFRVKDEYIRPVQEIDYQETSYYQFSLEDEFELFQLEDVPIA